MEGGMGVVTWYFLINFVILCFYFLHKLLEVTFFKYFEKITEEIGKNCDFFVMM